jgi:NADPH2:quinone reductase
MQAAFYERTGPAHEVLQIDEIPTPIPGAGEVRVKVAWSGVNPSDVKSRTGLRTRTLPFPRIIPHSDAGVIDEVGSSVLRRIGGALGSGTADAPIWHGRNMWFARKGCTSAP